MSAKTLLYYARTALPAHPDIFLAAARDVGYDVLVDEVGRWFIQDYDGIILDDGRGFLTRDHAIRHLVKLFKKEEELRDFEWEENFGERDWDDDNQ